MKDAKKILSQLTGIKEENQTYLIKFYFSGYEEFFWNDADLLIYDQTRYLTKIKRKNYAKDILLNLNYNIKNLKKLVFLQSKVDMGRQKFLLDNSELSDDQNLKLENLYLNNLEIKISKKINDMVYVEYPNQEKKKIKTDLFSTGLEFLEQIEQIYYNKDNNFNLKYYLSHQNKILNLDELLILSGVKNEDLLQLTERKLFQINLKVLGGNTITIDVGPYDTVNFFKNIVHIKAGLSIEQQRIIFEGKKLDNKKTLHDYNIQQGANLELVFEFFEKMKEKYEKELKREELLKKREEKMKKEQEEKKLKEQEQLKNEIKEEIKKEKKEENI